MPRLNVKSANDNGSQSFNLRLGTNKLGRTADNDLQIDHPTVSTLHCEIIWLNDAVTVVDRVHYGLDDGAHDLASTCRAGFT